MLDPSIIFKKQGSNFNILILLRCVMTKKEKEALYLSIYDDYYENLYRYAYKISGSKNEAEDVVQEAFLRAWKSLESLKDTKKAKSWLMTILKREFIRKRELDKANQTDSLENFEYLLESDIDLELKSETSEVLKMILALEKDYQETLVLQAIYGYRITEISKLLNINENTISTRLFRARKQLKCLVGKKIKKERILEEINYL